MGKKDKKKGKGAEKTALKTEKKTLNKIKKELAAKGEDDIEKLIAEYQVKGAKTKVVTEEICSQPSPRSGFSFCPHPDKDELVLFGGEYYNGSKTTMFDDMYFYNIKKGQWSLLQCPEKPPPRCSHQAVVVSQCGGQMWVFGGEFASPSRSSFYHYKDLWVFHFSEKRWELVKAPGAPTSRSGHRMVASKKQIVLFGGFHESLQDYKYFNDAYIFNLESYSWSKLEPLGKTPSPRSGCLMAPLTDGRILLYGGYTREKVKKDVDKGIAYTDMYYLQVDDRTSPPKWKWVQAKPSGTVPSARSGFFAAASANNVLFAFGGVHDDHPDEERLTSVFHDDLFLLELERGRWTKANLHGGKRGEKGGAKKRRRRGRDEEEDEEEEVEEMMEKTTIRDEGMEENTEHSVHSVHSEHSHTYDDSIFTVKIGPSTSKMTSEASTCGATAADEIFMPPARMSASLAVKNGVLYLYGGQIEEEKRNLTLSDFYSLDIHKLDEWRTIVPFSTKGLEWIESDESESEDDDDNDDGGDDDTSDEESEDSGEGEEMDTQ